MSRSDAHGSGSFSGSPRLKYRTFHRGPEGDTGNRVQLDKEGEEEAQQQFDRNLKQLGCAMVLLPVTIITRRLLTNAWNSWGVVLVMILITGVGAQDLGEIEADSGLPA